MRRINVAAGADQVRMGLLVAVREGMSAAREARATKIMAMSEAMAGKWWKAGLPRWTTCERSGGGMWSSRMRRGAPARERVGLVSGTGPGGGLGMVGRGGEMEMWWGEDGC